MATSSRPSSPLTAGEVMASDAGEVSPEHKADVIAKSIRAIAATKAQPVECVRSVKLCLIDGPAAAKFTEFSGEVSIDDIQSLLNTRRNSSATLATCDMSQTSSITRGTVSSQATFAPDVDTLDQASVKAGDFSLHIYGSTRGTAVVIVNVVAATKETPIGKLVFTRKRIQELNVLRPPSRLEADPVNEFAAEGSSQGPTTEKVRQSWIDWVKSFTHRIVVVKLPKPKAEPNAEQKYYVYMTRPRVPTKLKGYKWNLMDEDSKEGDPPSRRQVALYFRDTYKS